jgi:hypothetical protein
MAPKRSLGPSGKRRVVSGRPSWIAWALLVGAAAVASIGVPRETALARLFFVLVLGGALISGLSVVGARWQAGAAGTLMVLLALEGLVQRPVHDPPASQWLVTLTSPAQRLRHTLLLPLSSKDWQRWWDRAAGAAVHVCAKGPLDAASGLDLYVNEDRIARVTDADAYGPGPELTSVRFYRVPVSRAALERSARTVVELRLAPDAASRPVEICGTFTYRPTAGIGSSEFFDGTAWQSPGPRQGGRYAIEIRLEDPSRKPLAALY